MLEAVLSRVVVEDRDLASLVTAQCAVRGRRAHNTGLAAHRRGWLGG